MVNNVLWIFNQSWTDAPKADTREQNAEDLAMSPLLHDTAGLAASAYALVQSQVSDYCISNFTNLNSITFLTHLQHYLFKDRGQAKIEATNSSIPALDSNLARNPQDHNKNNN